jgi:hypothetical protein
VKVIQLVPLAVSHHEVQISRSMAVSVLAGRNETVPPQAVFVEAMGATPTTTTVNAETL